jgi:membrane protease YdiL (CAAX protease family)
VAASLAGGRLLDIPGEAGDFLMVMLFTAAVLLVIVTAIKAAGLSPRDYLALHWPDRRYLLIGLGLVAVKALLSYTLAYFFLSPEVFQDLFSEPTEGPVAFLLVLSATAIGAPIAEEILFRGFMMRGWMASRLGIQGAIVLSSVLFAALHFRPTLWAFLLTLVGALLYGFMRWRSGSTVLAIMMHATWNAVNVTLSLLV